MDITAQALQWAYLAGAVLGVLIESLVSMEGCITVIPWLGSPVGLPLKLVLCVLLICRV